MEADSLAGAGMAKAPCQTIRLRLPKIGAQVRITVRKIWISLAAGHPATLPGTVAPRDAGRGGSQRVADTPHSA